MVALSDRVRLAGTKYDRRAKLTEDQKATMKWLHEEEKVSYNKLGAMFNVSKRCAIFACNPDKYEISKKQARERRKDGRYKLTSEDRAVVAKEHKKYKRKLLQEHKIELRKTTEGRYETVTQEEI